MNAGGVDKACKSCGLVARQDSGKRVNNTRATSPRDGYNPPKGGLIPDGPLETQVFRGKASALWDWPVAYQLVGRVMAYQGYDG